MKIYLASYLQPFYHGPGRKVAIANSKPDNLKLDCVFLPFIPEQSILDYYNQQKDNNPKDAGKFFVDSFKKQLKDFIVELNEEAKKQGRNPQEILPFQDGDTLLSWERYERQNYRSIVAEVLIDLGYEVILK